MSARFQRNRRASGFRWLAGVLLSGVLVSRLAAASLVATLDRNTTQAGDPVQLSLTFSGGTPAEPPAVPNVPNLSIAYRGQSSQFQIINGRASSSVSYSYAVTASQPGEYTLPAVRVVADGQTLTSQPVKLAVGKGDDRLAQVAFLRLVAPKTEAFVGEALLLEIQLFARAGRLVQPPQLKGEGVTIGKLAQVGAAQVLTNGIAYQLVTYRVPVTFVKTGDFALSAGDCLLDVQFRRQPRRSDPFGLGLDDFFGEVQRLTLASEPVTIKVRPLPSENVPPDFTGAVGDFNLSASLSTNTVTAGDPLTLTVQIAGRGPIESLRWAPSGAWTGFKTYAPSMSVKTADDLGLSGVKTFEQAVIAESVLVKEIPPVTFSFFDPQKGRYRTLTHPAMPITVKPAALAPAQPVVVAARNPTRPDEKPATDIVHIKTRPGTFAQVAPPLIERPWFLALQSLPVLAWLGALAWRRRADRLARNPRLRRRQQVIRLVSEGLIELNRLAAQNRNEDFFAAVFRLLQEQLGERLDLPASAITEAVVEERLEPLGLDAPLLTSTRELFQLCNQARYAPTQQPGELAALAAKVEATLRQLQAIRSDARH